VFKGSKTFRSNSQEKKVNQAAEGITAYKVKAPSEKTAKTIFFPPQLLVFKINSSYGFLHLTMRD